MSTTTSALALLAAAALACLGVGAQTITGVAIETNGWQALVWVSNLGTNGTYSYGLGTNNSITGGEKLKLTLTSQAFNPDGTATTKPRTIYGTARVRKPYPDHGSADEVVEGSNVKLRIALSDWVTTSDSGITATLGSALYAQGGTNSASASGLSVTNNSVQIWKKTIPAWSYPWFNRETGSVMRLRAVAFHTSGHSGKPVELMRFIVKDETGNSLTNDQTAMQIDRTRVDYIPTGEYVADIPLAGFVNGEQLRCDFVAYPRMGDTNAIFDTRENFYTGVTPLPCAITNLCDRLGTYSSVTAAVDPVNGSDTNGRTTNVTYSLILTNHYFATLAKAWQSVRTNNNTAHGHDDVGGGIVWVRSGVNNWLGGSQSYGTTPKAVGITAVYPGDTVTFTNQTGNQDISDRVKISGEGGTLTLGGAASFFSATDYLWLDQLTVNNAHASAIAQECDIIWVTDSKVTQLTQGLKAFTTQTTSWLLRNVDITGMNGGLQARTAIGVYKTSSAGDSYTVKTDYNSGQTIPPEYFVLYNCYLPGMRGAGANVDMGLNLAVTNGGAIVQCVFEISTNLSGATFNLFSNNSLNYSNILICNVVFKGKRIAGAFYRDAQTNQTSRYLCQMRNTIIDNCGLKTDTFTTGDGSRIGNWPVMWGVGHWGMWYLEQNTTGNEAAGSFNPEEPNGQGLSSYHPPGSGTNNMAYPRFVAPKAQGEADTSGAGDYRLLSESPGHLLHGRDGRAWLTPWDLRGFPRGDWDPPGPYAAGNRRRGM